MQIKTQNEISPHIYQNGLQKQTIKQKKHPKSNKQKMTSVGEDIEKLEHLNTIGGNVKWCTRYGKHYGISSKD